MDIELASDQELIREFTKRHHTAVILATKEPKLKSKKQEIVCMVWNGPMTEALGLLQMAQMRFSRNVMQEMQRKDKE